MKKFYLCIIIITLSSACSNDGALSTDSMNTANSSHYSKASDIPANMYNDYDIAGQIHNEILSACYETTLQPHTLNAVAELVETKAAANIRFGFIVGSSYRPLSREKIAYIANLKPNTVDFVIDDSGLSTGAKANFKDFMSSLLELVTAQENYHPIYEFIVAYEAQVSANPKFNPHDKEVILTTTSIARHSVFLKKKKPKKNTDPDWDWMTGNLMGGTEGAANGTAEAIAMALAVGIYENSN